MPTTDERSEPDEPGVPDELSPLLESLRAAEHYTGAVDAAVRHFTEHLYAAIDRILAELLSWAAPGVTPARRFVDGRYERLRFGWRDSAIVIVPQAGARLAPDAQPDQADQPDLGRVIIFQTAPEEEIRGVPIRDYLIDANAGWRFQGLGGPAEGNNLGDPADADRHALELLTAIQTRLRSKWVEAGQVTVMSEEGDDRAIGFVV